MTRAITGAMATEVTADKLFPLLLVSFEFDGGDINLWTGQGELTHSSIPNKTFLGAGDLFNIDGIEETGRLKASGIEFALSGIPSDIISIALIEQYQGRPVKVWFAAQDVNLVIINDPILLIVARMDIMEITDQGETATIKIKAENVLVTLERANETRYTPKDHNILFPGDLGLEFVESLQDKEIIWGTR